MLLCYLKAQMNGVESQPSARAQLLHVSSALTAYVARHFPFIYPYDYKNPSGPSGDWGFLTPAGSGPVMQKSVFIILAKGTLFHQASDSGSRAERR